MQRNSDVSRFYLPPPPEGHIPFSKSDLEQSIPQRFEQMVGLHPDRIALCDSGKVYTYEETRFSTRAATRRKLLRYFSTRARQQLSQSWAY
jgi:hypothetical protein